MPSLLMSRRVDKHPVTQWLDNRFFPFVVNFVVSRPHIIWLLALLPVLENPATPIALALALGNYTNVVSASASAIVLRQQSVHHEVLAERHEEHSDAFDQIMARLDAIEQRLGHAGTQEPR